MSFMRQGTWMMFSNTFADFHVWRSPHGTRDDGQRGRIRLVRCFAGHAAPCHVLQLQAFKRFLLMNRLPPRLLNGA